MRQTNQKRISVLGLSLFLVLCFCMEILGQVEESDISFAKRVKLNSKILNREMDISVYLPAQYNSTSSSYPVLYDLNSFCFNFDSGTVELLGGISAMPNMIVVGIPPLQNGYVPTPYENRGENPAGADLSIKFLKEEFIPFVEKNYRTNQFRILYGHSVGGLFTMYTLFNYPDLFTAYIAGSPWFQNNNQYWLKNIEKMAKKRNLEEKFLFMTVGKDESQLTIDTYKELEKWMKGKPFTGLNWKSSWVEGDHGSMLGRNIYDGLLFIFKGWKIPNSVLRPGDVKKIDQYLKTNSAKWTKYGFKASAILPEQRLNSLGYALIRLKENEKAIKIFKYNIKRFPKSFNAHDSLAEAYLIIGDKVNAIKNYQLAVKLNPGKSDYEKRILKNSHDKLEELGVKKD